MKILYTYRQFTYVKGNYLVKVKNAAGEDVFPAVEDGENDPLAQDAQAAELEKWVEEEEAALLTNREESAPFELHIWGQAQGGLFSKDVWDDICLVSYMTLCEFYSKFSDTQNN